ncbi:MAG: PDZ domain-containing protein, partial [Planctomycetota bacterium]
EADEKPADEAPASGAEAGAPGAGAPTAGEEEEGEQAPAEPATPSIDVAGLDQRILALPLSEGNYDNLQCTEKALLFVEETPGGERILKSFDFEEREAKTLKEGVQGFTVSGDGKSLLTFGKGAFAITDAKGGDPKPLAIDSVRVRVEPAQEWPQILREVWRIERDYFYDEKMHGVDWPAMWERWQAFLPHVQHRGELTLLIQEMIGELCCGHEYVGGGEYPEGPESISVGLLGADLALDAGRWRIARILRGQNWNPGLRAPLTEPGVDAREGDYLLAVNGQPLDATMNLHRAFEYTADKQVELTLSATPDGAEPRTVRVVPVGSDFSLRTLSWIEANRRRVDELSGGRLAYVYMPNTGEGGRAAFDRDFYSQLDREGLILDERYNGGGQVADYVIETLSRDLLSYWMNRERWLGFSPAGVLDGPKVMIINENAGSGGDWMPWAFQRQKIGPLVGTRTWGGLVGISGYPPLLDGGMVTAASFGVMDAAGEWAVENVGVAPDHEVIEWPRDVIAGRDPQLERAVELALEALETWPKGAAPAYHAPAKR